MKTFPQKLHSYCKTQYNHFISPFYERFYENLDFGNEILTDPNSPVIGTLTSYPDRFSTLHLCIKSILNQSFKLKKLILYLDDFVPDDAIGQKILDLKKNGLEIKKTPYDLRNHKKYFFALKEFSQNPVITFDDDVIYRKNDVKKLMQCYKKNPGCVSALRVHKIAFNKDGTFASYSHWKKEYSRLLRPSHLLFAVGVGGVLYPPGIFPQEVFNVDLIKENCFKADDIYLKFMELKYKIPVVYKWNPYNHPVEIAAWRDTGLNIENINKNINDQCVKNMSRLVDTSGCF